MVAQDSGSYAGQRSGQMPLCKAMEFQSLHQVTINLYQTVLPKVLLKSRGRNYCHLHIGISASHIAASRKYDIAITKYDQAVSLKP